MNISSHLSAELLIYRQNSGITLGLFIEKIEK